MSWAGVKVLVTGAGGFIGSHLTESLVRAGAETRVFVRYNSRGELGWLDDSEVKDSVDVYAGDIADSDLVTRAVEGRDVVFHLAALIGIPYSYSAPRSYLHTNVEGTLNVLGAVQRSDSHLVHTSTSEVYGSALSVPISEDHPLQAQSPYSASKVAADKLAESFFKSFGTRVVTVRPFNTYGPRQSARAVIPTIIAQCLAGAEEIRLGNASPTRDFTHVSDTVQGFLKAGASQDAVGQTINLGSGIETSIEEVVGLVAGIVGVVPKIVEDPVRVRSESSEVDRLCADASKAHELLGWKPQTELQKGLADTIGWFRTHIQRYRPHDYAV